MREGGREKEREGEREGGRKGGREKGREGEREGEREKGRVGEREGGRKGGREKGREGGREGGRGGGREEKMLAKTQKGNFQIRSGSIDPNFLILEKLEVRICHVQEIAEDNYDSNDYDKNLQILSLNVPPTKPNQPSCGSI